MPHRHAALAILLTLAACSPATSVTDAGAEHNDAASDAERHASAGEAADPGAVDSPTVVDAPLTELAAQLVGAGSAVEHTDPAREPPSTLLRAAVRGARPDGAAPRIVRSADGRDLWVVSGRGASHWTNHIHLNAPPPQGSRVLPVYGLPYEELGFALVDDLAQAAVLLPAWREASAYAIEAAPALSEVNVGQPTGNIGQPVAHANVGALDATLELRWMKSCPTSRTECLLYGSPRAVATAVDPVEPPGGWSVVTTDLAVPTPRALPPDATEIGDDVQIAVLTERTDDHDGVCGIFAWLDGPTTIDALEIPCYDDQGFTGGVFATDENMRLVWVWEVEAARLHFAVIDAKTNAHRGTPRTVAADSYYEVDCGNVWSGTRPLPVLDGAHIGVALTWGGGEALYFAEGTSRGRVIRAQLPDPFADEDGVDQLPPVLRTTRCAGRLCVEPAPAIVTEECGC